MSRFSFSKSSNPMLNEARFEAASRNSEILDYTGQSETMTVSGTVNKTFILMGLMLATAIYSWINPSQYFVYGGMIVGLIASLVTAIRPQYAQYSAPVYAAAEGLFLGSLSVMVQMMVSGTAGLVYGSIVFQAITITIGILFLMLTAYKAGWIKVTDKFRSGVMIATGGLMLFYLLTMVLRWFGVGIPFIHEMGTMGHIICGVAIVLASMNLLLDFDTIEKGAEYNAPKYMEWVGAMGLLVTLVWLYIEILRLLMILSSSRD